MKKEQFTDIMDSLNEDHCKLINLLCEATACKQKIYSKLCDLITKDKRFFDMLVSSGNFFNICNYLLGAVIANNQKKVFELAKKELESIEAKTQIDTMIYKVHYLPLQSVKNNMENKIMHLLVAYANNIDSLKHNFIRPIGWFEES